MPPERPLVKLARADSAVVIGLGRFGSALAVELERLGTDVLGIDTRDTLVQQHANLLTKVVRADCTDRETLLQLAVPKFDRVVLAIGSHIESSLLTASLLLELELDVRSIWAKATSHAHAQILRRLGVDHVVSPEADMGRRLAHIVRGAMVEYVEFDPDYAMVKTQPPHEAIGRTLAELRFRSRYGVTVVGIRDGNRAQPWRHATPESIIHADDWLIAAGTPKATEAFALLR